MKHALRITVSKGSKGAIAACKKLTVREKLLKLFLGDKAKLTLIVPGDDVAELSICKAEEISHETV